MDIRSRLSDSVTLRTSREREDYGPASGLLPLLHGLRVSHHKVTERDLEESLLSLKEPEADWLYLSPFRLN